MINSDVGVESWREEEYAFVTRDSLAPASESELQMPALAMTSFHCTELASEGHTCSSAVDRIARKLICMTVRAPVLTKLVWSLPCHSRESHRFRLPRDPILPKLICTLRL
jgi:hypothetical protein